MASNGHTEINIRRGVPYALKQALVKDADAKKVSQNDVIVGVLAAHFGETFEPSGRVGAQRPATESDQLVIRVPERIRLKLVMASERQHLSRSTYLLRVLCSHFGVRTPAPPSRGRRGRVATTGT